MAISLPEGKTEYYVPPHYFIGSRIGEKAHIIRSGIVLLPNEPNGKATGLKGESPGKWRREKFELQLDLEPSIQRAQPRPPSQGHYWGIRYEQWAATAAPNAMFNENVSNNAGYAVDAVTLVDPHQKTTVAQLDLDLAIRDNDGYLFRVSYYLHIIGTLEEAEVVG